MPSLIIISRGFDQTGNLSQSRRDGGEAVACVQIWDAHRAWQVRHPTRLTQPLGLEADQIISDSRISGRYLLRAVADMIASSCRR